MPTEKQLAKAIQLVVDYAPERIDIDWAEQEIQHLTQPATHVHGQSSLLCARCGSVVQGVSAFVRDDETFCATCYTRETP